MRTRTCSPSGQSCLASEPWASPQRQRRPRRRRTPRRSCRPRCPSRHHRAPPRPPAAPFGSHPVPVHSPSPTASAAASTARRRRTTSRPSQTEARPHPIIPSGVILARVLPVRTATTARPGAVPSWRRGAAAIAAMTLPLPAGMTRAMSRLDWRKRSRLCPDQPCRPRFDGMSRILERLTEAQNYHDAVRFASYFSDDYQSDQPAHPDRTFSGRGQVLENWTSVFAGVPALSRRTPGVLPRRRRRVGRGRLERPPHRRFTLRHAWGHHCHDPR